MAEGPLAGIKVLEVSQIIAGPFCGINLADLGADVVKLEPLGGEGGRALGQFMPGESKFFIGLNRGKRGITVDLQTERGQELVHRLIPQFDVFVINARPSVPPRLRVDYETLRGFRPDLIYVENTGYGKAGPSAERSGSDIVAQAYSGLMAGDGKQDDFGGPELITATAPADYTAGTAAAMGVCAALFHRQRTGEGQYVSTSLLAAGLALQGLLVSRVPPVDAMIRDPMMEQVEAVRAAGGTYAELLAARGSLSQLLGSAFRLYYGGYDASDGAIILGALTEKNRDQIRSAIGLDDDPTAAPDFNGLDPANTTVVDETRERIRAIFRTRTVAQWTAVLDTAGAPASGVNLPEEMSDDPQVIATGLMLDLEHELVGPVRMVGPMVQMSATPTGSPLASPPLDAHTDAVLSEFGIAADEIADLRASHVIGSPPGGAA